jgi:hypothetical protein
MRYDPRSTFHGPISDRLLLRALPPSLRDLGAENITAPRREKRNGGRFCAKKEAGCYPGFSISHTCLSAEDRPKSASLPIYFLPHLDKRKPSKISLSATQKSRAANPAFCFHAFIGRSIREDFRLYCH